MVETNNAVVLVDAYSSYRQLQDNMYEFLFCFQSHARSSYTYMCIALLEKQKILRLFSKSKCVTQVNQSKNAMLQN